MTTTVKLSNIPVYILHHHLFIYSPSTVKYPFICPPAPLSNSPVISSITTVKYPCIYSKSPWPNTPSYILNHHGQIPLYIFSITAVKYPTIYSPSLLSNIHLYILHHHLSNICLYILHHHLSNICLYILHHRCQISVYIFSIAAVKYLFIYSP